MSSSYCSHKDDDIPLIIHMPASSQSNNDNIFLNNHAIFQVNALDLPWRSHIMDLMDFVTRIATKADSVQSMYTTCIVNLKPTGHGIEMTDECCDRPAESSVVG